MKIQSLCLSFVVTFLAFQSIFAEDADLANDRGEIIFRVFEDNRIRVHNLHRAKKPSIKFSLHGTTVEKVDKKNASHWSMSLDDKSTVDFVVEEIRPNMTEYYLLWHGGGTNSERKVCFYIGYNHAKWFRGYQSMNASWPMNVTKTILEQQFNFLFDRHIYDRNIAMKEHISILEHLYLISDGFAILLDEHVPWFIESPSNGDDPILCFSANNKTPFKTNELDPSYLNIKIHIFTSSNIRSVTDYVVHQSNYIPKPIVIPEESVIKYTTWFERKISYFRPIKEELFTKFSDDLENNRFPSKNKIILELWDISNIDDLLKYNEFPDEKLLLNLKKKGIEIGIEFAVLDFNSQHVLSEQFCIKSTWIIDFSMPDACKLFTSQLVHLKNQKQIDAFAFLASTNIQSFFFNDTFVQKYPSILTTRFIEAANQVGNTIISEYAFKTQHLPIWVRLSNHRNTPYDQLLLELIPNVLSVSIAGYSFVVPYTAGGLDHNTSPTEEQFIRMMQAITFMPAVSIGYKPWELSQKAVEITKKCLQMHSEHITTILELAKVRIKDGSPIVRPMWYVAPDDPKTYSIGDQYMLGDDILVAPVVRLGKTERIVYLTTGTWIDKHGKNYQGPGEFTVAAPLEELPYFKRKL